MRRSNKGEVAAVGRSKHAGNSTHVVRMDSHSDHRTTTGATGTSPVSDSTKNQTTTTNPRSSVVVASLPSSSSSSQSSYHGLATSPGRTYAVLACPDTIQLVRISAERGIERIQTIVVTPYFQQPPPTSSSSSGTTTVSNTATTTGTTSYMYPSSFLRDFAMGGGRTSGTQPQKQNHHTNTNTNNNTIPPQPLMDTTAVVVVTAVAWSHGIVHSSNNNTSSPVTDNIDNNNVEERVVALSQDHDPMEEPRHFRTSMIAVAGSNGVICIWNVATLLWLEGSSSSSSRDTVTAPRTSTSPPPPPPVAILNHRRHVTALAFSPLHQGWLCSASQDRTVIVWEQRPPPPPPNTAALSSSTHTSQRHKHTTTNHHPPPPPQPQGLQGLFGSWGSHASSSAPASSVPAPHHPNVVPTNHPTWHCRTTFAPKSETIRDVQWSPILKDVFALVTSNGSLIVYNQYITARVIVRISAHSGDASTIHWHPTRPNVLATGGDRSVKIWDLEREFERELFHHHSTTTTGSVDIGTQNMERNASTGTSRGGESVGTNESSTVNGTDALSPYGTIGASSTTYGAHTFSSLSSAGNMNTSQHRKKNLPLHVLSISAAVTRIRWRPVANYNGLDGDDWHASMIAVSTAPIKGANAGGAGTLSLWSYHRPYMPLSIVEGHEDGAVVDFEWLETPQTSLTTTQNFPLVSNEMDSFVANYSPAARIWQHVISVGRDGHCFVQSLVRGDRPISRVPPSCFAMANLSPFQKGYGSLQLFSICQPVPSGPDSDVMLTGLRRDQITMNAPGIFRELPLDDNDPSNFNKTSDQITAKFPWKFCTRIPENSPQIHFNVIDQGDLDEDSNPVDDTFVGDNDHARAIVVAPEVVHLSRFAQRYKLYVDSECPTRIALCQHNAHVAESLSQLELANMWRIVTLMLESCILGDNSNVVNVDDESILRSKNNEMMQYVFLPALKRVLEERADAGDVQTCVVLCEVFEMIRSDQSVLIQDLEIEYIREWYLSYIDLLRDMCLFSYATYIIKHCVDPIINALNQQSTTIHESCPHCGKVMLQDDYNSTNKSTATDAIHSSFSNARRICKSCRRRVGLCFLCHEPVKGVYVWCPGCGHGGHLEHALQWFGGGGTSGGSSSSTSSLRTMCPTGCGHQCNLMRQVTAFPRTESFS